MDSKQTSLWIPPLLLLQSVLYVSILVFYILSSHSPFSTNLTYSIRATAIPRSLSIYQKMTYSENDKVFTFVCPSSLCQEAGRAIPHHVLYAMDCNHCNMRLNQLPGYPHATVKAFRASNPTTADVTTIVSQEYVVTPSATIVSPLSPVVDMGSGCRKALENSMRHQSTLASQKQCDTTASNTYPRPNSNGKFPAKLGRKSDDTSEVSASYILATLTKDFEADHPAAAYLVSLLFLQNHCNQRWPTRDLLYNSNEATH